MQDDVENPLSTHEDALRANHKCSSTDDDAVTSERSKDGESFDKSEDQRGCLDDVQIDESLSLADAVITSHVSDGMHGCSSESEHLQPVDALSSMTSQTAAGPRVRRDDFWIRSRSFLEREMVLLYDVTLGESSTDAVCAATADDNTADNQRPDASTLSEIDEALQAEAEVPKCKSESDASVEVHCDGDSAPNTEVGVWQHYQKEAIPWSPGTVRRKRLEMEGLLETVEPPDDPFEPADHDDVTRNVGQDFNTNENASPSDSTHSETVAEAAVFRSDDVVVTSERMPDELEMVRDRVKTIKKLMEER